MKMLVPLVCCIVLVSGCKKTNQEGCESGACIRTRIEQFTSSVICKSGAAVKLYNFQGKCVFVFDESNCTDFSDGAAAVYDANCNYMGMLGGIAGFRKINGLAFYENAAYIKTIWQN